MTLSKTRDGEMTQHVKALVTKSKDPRSYMVESRELIFASYPLTDPHM